MSLVSLASCASAWRGYEYYRDKKVKSCKATDGGQYEGLVSGSNKAVYQVKIDPEHPRSSQCSCPHANGKRIVCKHMVALFFTAFPKEAEAYYAAVLEAEEEADREYERLEHAVVERVMQMKKDDLRQTILQMLFDGPEWQFDRFIRENLGEY